MVRLGWNGGEQSLLMIVTTVGYYWTLLVAPNMERRQGMLYRFQGKKEQDEISEIGFQETKHAACPVQHVTSP